MWCILLPFIYIFDRLFGGWKDNNLSQLESIKDNEKEKTIRQSKRD